MFKTRFMYKGYTLWRSSDHIIMLYIPNAEIGTTHHALSFDNGNTWCVANNQSTVYSDYRGSFTEVIDICVELNERCSNEKQ